MSKLVLTLEGKIVNHYFIEKSSITIGRDASNDIAINDPLLGDVHVRITRAGQDDIAEGVMSRGGSRLNGKPLGRQILQHRDIIELGSHQLRYMSSRVAADADLDRTMLIQTLARPNGDTKDAPAMVMPMATPPRPALQAGRVEILAGLPPHQAGQFVSLDRVVTTFGVPGDKLIVLTRRPQGVFLTHVEGSKFPRVNRHAIGNVPHALKDGDIIEAAGYKLKFIA
jgi:pSer/pThr/pTyr-binding forkhead associated (FHA) protein